MTDNNQSIGQSAKLTAQLRTTLLDAVKAAANKTLPMFRTPMNIDNKLDKGFDPVTEADRAAETAIRQIITDRFPDHAIIGEEWENKLSDSPYTWIIDPIDGTRAYMSGVPVWGTLIGITHNGQAIAGIMDQPFTGETYIATNGEAELIHNGKKTSLQARTTTDLDSAVFFTTDPALFSKPGQIQAFEAVRAKARLTRYSCDCYAYTLLAAGHIDLVIEPAMNTYDIAALVPIIESAGGVISTWNGDRAEGGGDIIAAATPQLHAAALATMAPHLAN